jgi:hypothetical protein
MLLMWIPPHTTRPSILTTRSAAGIEQADKFLGRDIARAGEDEDVPSLPGQTWVMT